MCADTSNDEAELIANIVAISSLDSQDVVRVLEVARHSAAEAKALLEAYQAAAAPGTPNFVEKAWSYIQVGLQIAGPAISISEAAAGLPGIFK